MNPRTYADSAHLHAATAIGSAYTAAYDAAGNMTWSGAVEQRRHLRRQLAEAGRN